MTTAPVEIERTGVEGVTESAEKSDRPWSTIVWNDPINLMSYVSYVFESYFGYPKPKAHKLMLDVHHRGKAVVAHGTREEMERDVSAMHSFGLWATLQHD